MKRSGPSSSVPPRSRRDAPGHVVERPPTSRPPAGHGHAELASGLAVQIAPIDERRDGAHVHRLLELPPAQHLREDPGRVRAPREGGREAREAMDAVRRRATRAAPTQAPRSSRPRACCASSTRFAGLVAPVRRLEQRAEQRAGAARRAASAQRCVHGEHLLGRVLPDVVPASAGRRRCRAATATLLQGSPTQKPSTAPASSFSTMRGGGTTQSSTSRSGWMPNAASQ